MIRIDRFYAGGIWHGCTGDVRHELVNPATGEITGDVRFGSDDDLMRAVAAAAKASQVGPSRSSKSAGLRSTNSKRWCGLAAMLSSMRCVKISVVLRPPGSWFSQ